MRVSWVSLVSFMLVLSTPPHVHAGEGLDPLYQRMARDIRQQKPIVITVHVALCDNRIITCGSRALGNGDVPAKNLYWGGAAGFTAFFRSGRGGWRRLHRDGGDGKVVLSRVVYRRWVRPNARWRRLGIRRSFELILVGLAYRGMRIETATRRFVNDVHTEHTRTLHLGVTTPNGVRRRIDFGGAGHIVGYAGHNHLMDVTAFRWPKWSRHRTLGYFALACKTTPYFIRQLSRSKSRGLLLTRTFMYPGAFTIEGLLQGIAEGLSQREVFRRGADRYAHYQKRPRSVIRRAFTHDARLSTCRRYQLQCER